MNRSLQLSLLLGTLLSPLVAHGQPGETPPLITDRPDFTESSAAVPPLRLQAELGAEFSWPEGTRELSLPNLLLRFGLVKGIELRAGTPSLKVAWDDSADGQLSSGGLTLGAKLVTPLGERYAIGILPFVVLPLLAGEYDSEGVQAGALLVGSIDLGEQFGLGWNAGVNFQRLGAQSSDTVSEFLASLSLGISLTDKLGIFVEVFSTFTSEEARPVLDTGLTYLVMPHLQLDTYFGMQLNDLPHGFFGLGFSVLL